MTMIWKTVQNNEQCSVLQSTAVSAVRGEDEWWGLQCCSVPAIIMLQLQHQPGSTLSPTQPLTVTNISMSQTFYRICFEKNESKEGIILSLRFKLSDNFSPKLYFWLSWIMSCVGDSRFPIILCIIIYNYYYHLCIHFPIVWIGVTFNITCGEAEKLLLRAVI